jgi:plastocyanin
VSNKKGGTAAMGIIVSVLIIGAIGAVGYYQVNIAPGIFASSSSTTTQAASCTPSSCINVTIPNGAGSGATSCPAGCYLPYKFTVVVGVNNTVIWTNNDVAPHTVTAKDGSFNSGNMNPGDTFEFTFTQPGSYEYGCSYHSWMNGTVVVVAG